MVSKTLDLKITLGGGYAIVITVRRGTKYLNASGYGTKDGEKIRNLYSQELQGLGAFYTDRIRKAMENGASGISIDESNNPQLRQTLSRLRVSNSYSEAQGIQEGGRE